MVKFGTPHKTLPLRGYPRGIPLTGKAGRNPESTFLREKAAAGRFAYGGMAGRCPRGIPLSANADSAPPFRPREKGPIPLFFLEKGSIPLFFPRFRRSGFSRSLLVFSNKRRIPPFFGEKWMIPLFFLQNGQFRLFSLKKVDSAFRPAFPLSGIPRG